MPKIKPVEVPKPEEVPIPQPQREPSRPTEVPNRPRVPEPSKRARRLTGSIGNQGKNTINPDDEPFGKDVFDPNDLVDLEKIQEQILDEVNDNLVSGVDIDKELEQLLGPDGNADPEDLNIANQTIDVIQNWLANHPFNRAARDYQQREWADDEFDSQAQRYAPQPIELTQGGDIDWDKMRTAAGLTPQQKEDHDLTPEELQKRQALRKTKLGSSAAAKAERAVIWSRLQNGEGYREIAPDYPDYHWGLVRDMARKGGKEAGLNTQQINAAERAASRNARARRQAAAVERLMDTMINASSESDLRSRLRDALEQVKNNRKRVSNEYQGIRKKNVELWRLASMMFDTMPEKKPGEPTIEYANRLRDWFYSTGDTFKNFGLDINDLYDVTTATNRSYDYLTDQYDMIQAKLSDTKNFWNELQTYKKGKNAGGSGLTGSMRASGAVRGIRIGSAPKSKPVDFRELDAVQGDVNKVMRGSFTGSKLDNRPKGLNKNENAIVSTVRAAQKFPKGFFSKGRKPKKA